MTTQDTTRRVVEGYFAAWTAKKVDQAYALLKDLLLWAAALSYHWVLPLRSGQPLGCSSSIHTFLSRNWGNDNRKYNASGGPAGDVIVSPCRAVDPPRLVYRCAHRFMLRSSGGRINGCGVGTAINYHLKPHLVRGTLDSCRGDAIEVHSS